VRAAADFSPKGSSRGEVLRSGGHSEEEEWDWQGQHGGKETNQEAVTSSSLRHLVTGSRAAEGTERMRRAWNKLVGRGTVPVSG
jgi:hypothetical protein